MTLGALQFAVPLLPRVYIYIQQYNTHTRSDFFFPWKQKGTRDRGAGAPSLEKKILHAETNDR
jgi:hypothetical protein